MAFDNYLRRLMSVPHLEEEEVENAFKTILEGRASQAQIGALLMAFNMKLPSFQEINGVRNVLIRNMKKVSAPNDAIDIVGTGGDNLQTYNISTATAILVAACDIKVVKHGNRAVSSVCGAADIIEALGIRLIDDPDKLVLILQKIGIVFLFAPYHHPCLKNVAKIRKELKVRTIFNLVGPLCNPAMPQFMLVGVSNKRYMQPVANAIAKNVKKAWVVIGDNNIDEINIAGETHILSIENGKMHKFSITPQDAGLQTFPINTIQEKNPQKYPTAIKSIFSKNTEQQFIPLQNAVILNAAAALVIKEKTNDLKIAAQIARNAIENGSAQLKIQQLIQQTNQ